MTAERLGRREPLRVDDLVGCQPQYVALRRTADGVHHSVVEYFALRAQAVIAFGGAGMRGHGEQSVQHQTHRAQPGSREKPAHEGPPSKSMLNRKVCPSRLQQL